MRPMKVLIISYAFPPVGGAGVQRVLKLVKYLPSCGVTPSVLTVAQASVPILDASLENDIPIGTCVLRARTLEPGYGAKKRVWESAANVSEDLFSRIKRQLIGFGRRLLVPDPQLLWLPAAGRVLAQRLFSALADDAVFISGPPFSQFLLAALARLKPGVAVILDYRDEWTTTANGYEMSGSAVASLALERAVLHRAHAVTTATEQFRAALLARFSRLDPGKVFAIPNGYDPEDFPPGLPSPPKDRFVLSYVGTIFRLTSARGLIEAVRLLHAREPELAKLLEIRFIGRIVDTEARYFEGTEAIGIQRFGYIDHNKAIELLAESHVALCILDDVEGAPRIYPAKIFEIMQIGRPCLALTPEGALADLIRRHQLGEVIAPGDSQKIAMALERMLRGFRDGDQFLSKPIDIERFDRRLQARQFADVFRATIAGVRGEPLSSAVLSAP